MTNRHTSSSSNESEGPSIGEIRIRAHRRGVQTVWTDAMGEVHEVSEEALTAVLDVLDAGGPDEKPPITPVAVAWDGSAIRIAFSGPDDGDLAARLVLESGEERAVPVEGLEFALPGDLPHGYHDFSVTTGESEYHTLIVSAPRTAFRNHERLRGLTAFLPLYALRTKRSPVAGDYTALGDLAEWAGKLGRAQVATLPLFSAFLDHPYDPSPYSPVSRLFLNEVYCDVGEMEGEAEDLVDFRALMAAKRERLEKMAADRDPAVDEFVAANPEVTDYAEFRAKIEGGGDEAVRYHEFVQWLADKQLADAAARAESAGSGLVLDLPIGSSPGGYDVARYGHLFAKGVGTGAPPDELFDQGQDWGLPPLHPVAIRHDRYRYVRAVLRRLMGAAATLRIDHVMGLHRLFWVPAGFKATEGTYVRYPAHEMYAILTLESHRNRCELVGENLGTVPDEVRDSMRSHGIRGMYVVPFETRDDPDLAMVSVPNGEIASVNTHDMPMHAAWWGEGQPVIREYLERQGLLEPDAESSAAFLGILSFLAGTGAGEVAFSLEDLWGETRPQNVPGTTMDEPNFRRSATRSFEEFSTDPAVKGAIEGLALRRAAGLAVSRSTGLTDDDLCLFNEGSHHELGEKLGAHPVETEGIRGTRFAVWAPGAERVSVMGDFNRWNEESHPLSARGSSGIWEGFLPGIGRGAIYKFRIHGRDGYRVDKADPVGVHQETPPKTGSVVWQTGHEWSDGGWMERRAAVNGLTAPISVYEMHLGSWRRVPEEGNRSLTYREMAEPLAAWLTETGFTHVEFLPVMEHPFGGSWGYQVGGFFAPTSRFGSPDDFMFLVDALHGAGLGVILDWVPSHFPKDEHTLGFFDGSHLFEHADPRKGLHPDWDSLIFNYGRHEVRSFLLSVAMHWLGKFHADGLRTDAVASMLYLDYSRKEGEWIPNEHGGRENLEAMEFLKRLSEDVYKRFPDVQTIAEESTDWPGVSRPTWVGGLGFGMKWDMGWMHDTLSYMQKDPIHRRYHHRLLTFRQLYAWSENFMLPLSHDEVVHGKGSLIGKMAGDDWQKFANLRLLYGHQWSQPGKKLLFMGCEIAQRAEWDHDGSVEWHLLEHAPHRGIRDWVRDLNKTYRAEPALHEKDCEPDGFEWIDADDADNSILAFLRKGSDPEDPVLCVLNFTPVPRESRRVGVPFPGEWREILNSDAEI
jgi:alpha-1,4-glucan:alpha-1,4-glucan 6-glycosyltransferase